MNSPTRLVVDYRFEARREERERKAKGLLLFDFPLVQVQFLDFHKSNFKFSLFSN
jgi:hypothetical protein